ncbi:MAG: cation transporter [Clostridia bacterium]|nr:cation transporter [Clostridia bacterium]
MKKTWMIEDLDCAHCAMKMQEGIAKIAGVTAASVNFLSGRLTIEAEESELDRIIREAVKVCKKIEPDCRIVL